MRNMQSGLPKTYLPDATAAGRIGRVSGCQKRNRSQRRGDASWPGLTVGCVFGFWMQKLFPLQYPEDFASHLVLEAKSERLDSSPKCVHP